MPLARAAHLVALKGCARLSSSRQNDENAHSATHKKTKEKVTALKKRSGTLPNSSATPFERRVSYTQGVRVKSGGLLAEDKNYEQQFIQNPMSERSCTNARERILHLGLLWQMIRPVPLVTRDPSRG